MKKQLISDTNVTKRAALVLVLGKLDSFFKILSIWGARAKVNPVIKINAICIAKVNRDQKPFPQERKSSSKLKFLVEPAKIKTNKVKIRQSI